jgi:4-amino-4-deoxy-L-arabinose transferase-like glycosyltransferase
VRRSLGLVAAITALAAALRFSTLGLQSYWYDEAVTVELVRRSLGGMLRALPDAETTPPLYYLLAWGWAHLFGSGEAGLRSLSALLGTATVPVAYAAACTLASRRAALVAAAFVAVSPILVWYSQEARAYALLVLLGAVALLFFARALRSAGRRDLAWWAVAAALGLATHYVAVFYVAPQAVWLLVRRRRHALWPVVGVTAAGLALLPLAAYQENGERTAWIHASPLRQRVKDAAHLLFSGFYTLNHAGAWALAVGVVTIVGLWTWTRGRERWGGRVALALGGASIALPFLLALASYGVGGRGDAFFFRELLPAWVPLAIAVACVVVSAARAPVVAAVVAGAAVLAVLATVRIDLRDELQRDDWRAVDRALGPPRATRAIVTSPPFQADVLRLYRPALAPLPPGGAPIDEVVVVTGVYGTTPAGYEPPMGFEESWHGVQHFALISARGTSRRRIVPRDLFSTPAYRAGAAVLVDGTGR